VVYAPLNLVYSHSRRIVSHIAPFHFSVVVVVNLIELEPFLSVPGLIVYSRKRQTPATVEERYRALSDAMLWIYPITTPLAVISI
jgi:hypothetical protein